MAGILEWWNNLMMAQQIFLIVAIPSSVILLIQTILLLVGLDDDIDVDADDFGDDGFALFSVRGIVSMLCITGWSGFALLGTSLPELVSILIAALLGFATLVGMAFLMRGLQKMQSSGNIEVSNAIGKVGQVYIPIPGGASASGKITLTIQEKYSEFSAITMESEGIPTGAYVRVIAVDEAGTLVVERAASGK